MNQDARRHARPLFYHLGRTSARRGGADLGACALVVRERLPQRNEAARRMLGDVPQEHVPPLGIECGRRRLLGGSREMRSAVSSAAGLPSAISAVIKRRQLLSVTATPYKRTHCTVAAARCRWEFVPDAEAARRRRQAITQGGEVRCALVQAGPRLQLEQDRLSGLRRRRRGRVAARAATDGIGGNERRSRPSAAELVDQLGTLCVADSVSVDERHWRVSIRAESALCGRGSGSPAQFDDLRDTRNGNR